MKHSKLFLTGMAALLLSFGLMMTGCDSGGDSDSDGGPADTEDTSLIYKSTDSGGTTTYVLILQDDTPAQGDNFALFVAPTATFGSAIPIDGAITGTPTATQIVLRPANNADGTNDITAAFNADGELTGLTTTGTHAGIAATGLTGQPVDTLAGTFGIDKSEPLVGDTITATLAPTTPSALNPTTQVVVYEWYSGDTADAITTRITDAGGNTYQVAVTGKFFKVDVRVIGYHGTKAAATTSASEAPLITEKDSAPFAVTAGDTALKITGTTTTASFKDGAGIKVYVKDTGKEALITDAASAPTGYAAPSGTPVLIAEHDATSGKPVLWVKGLDAAATPAPSGKLLSGTSDITVKIAVGAQDGDVGAVAAASGKPVVIVAQEYTVGNGEDNNTIKFTAGTPNKVKYDHGGTDVGDTNLDDTFDAALIAVLTVLEATDTIQFGAGGGAITDIGVLAASPTAAKVTAALGFAPAVTLGNDLSLTADFAVPAGKTLTVAAGKTITVAAEKVLDVTNGSIVLKANAATAIVLSPKNAAAADGGGAKLTFTGGSAHAVAKSGATSAQLTATADAAANLKFAGAGGTHITNLDNSTPAVINGSLVAGTSTGGNATDGTITLKGYASADVTISATTTFETTT